MDRKPSDIIPVKKHKIKPTIKQIMALKYINEGMSKRQAMIKAGYSPYVAERPTDRLMNAQGTKVALASMASELENSGLTITYMAGKFKEWMDATKIQTS